MKTLRSFHNLHYQAEIVVCGCGESLSLLQEPQRFLTIGVNDVGRLFHPDYLVVVNGKEQFSGDRFTFVENSQAKTLFTQVHNLPVRHPDVVRFKLGRYAGVDFSDPDILHYTQNSPYVAVCLAVQMGARRIGLIGVDFTERHFFADTGRHHLSGLLHKIDREYAALERACRAMGVELVNLSPVSRLTALPRAELSTIAPRRPRVTAAPPSTGLRIVSYATTPMAGVPAILARCISAVTGHTARCVWATDGYGNGVSFSGDVQWRSAPREALELLESADLIIAHNGKADPAHLRLLRSKPVVTMAHNYGWNVDLRFVKGGQPGVVVGQYQATLPEFAGWSVVPNPVPLWEPEYQPGAKGEVVTVAFTPSGRHESYPRGHRLYWHGKGFKSTMRVLRELSRRRELCIESTEHGQVSHQEALAMKRRAHIVIDECVTGSYHRNSLEGLAAGCVVVNGVGILPGVTEILRQCAGDYPDWLFQTATLDTLEQTLGELVSLSTGQLREEGARRRKWMEAHWQFQSQWERHWMPVVEIALNGKPAKGGRVIMPALPATGTGDSAAPPATASGLSAVVPFGGEERLPLLEATLAALRRSRVVDQIILIELGTRPVALDAAACCDCDYLFLPRDGAFDKAGALNAGTALARNATILWCDADLIFSEDFLEKALREFGASGVDYFYPFSELQYLSESDSREILAAARHPLQCRPETSARPMRDVPGGMGMVRGGFLRRFGGMIQGFLGWGGEDNAWARKVALAGRIGCSSSRDQLVWHLYHHKTGLLGDRPWKDNPHYQQNVALLDQVHRIKTSSELMRRFPPPLHAAPPWPSDRVIALLAAADAPARLEELAREWSRRLEAVYGITVPQEREQAAALAETRADAVVAFGWDPDSCNSFAALAGKKPVILVLAEQAPAAELRELLTEFSYVLPATAEQLAELRMHGVRVWHLPWTDSPGSGCTPPPVCQPLSVLLGAQLPLAGDEPRDGAISAEGGGGGAALQNQVRLPGLSVVIPYGGRERIRSLACSLGNLAQCPGVDEIIVVEQGEKAFGRMVCERWGVRYVFVPLQGPFSRARALNTGTTIASREFVLWKDVDLVLTPEFALRARAGMEKLKVDFLVPFFQINCLSEEDSVEVVRGTRSPADCRPIAVWEGGISNGGAAVVRAGFVDRFGGVEESFIGWGYEDHAWKHKAELLGRIAFSSDKKQILYHLNHGRTLSDRNRGVFNEISACRSAEQYLAKYPPPRFASCPWEPGRRIVLVADRDRGELAQQIAGHLMNTYGVRCEVLQTGAGDALLSSRLDSADALVFLCDHAAGEAAIADAASFAGRALIVTAAAEESGSPTQAGDGGSAAESFDVRSWTPPAAWNNSPLPRYAALALVDPLALLLNKPERAATAAPASLPFWTYWEGPCPEWIRACLSTFIKHAPQLRILDPASFDALRTHDRDIELQRLLVAQRADFIRAYLLAHFGGVWLDADCLLMRNPQEILHHLATGIDFIGYRDRQGYVANSFMAAPAGGEICTQLYQRICSRLRSGASLGWTSLGSEPLTDILRSAKVPWHEVECRLVQPVCWSQPGRFFERGEESLHEANLEPDAVFYMLSNVEVGKYRSSHPDAALLAGDTFFSFLVRKSLGESRAVSGSFCESGPVFSRFLQAISPSCVLQIGADSIFWAAFLREWWAEREESHNVPGILEAMRLPPLQEARQGLDLFSRIHESDSIPSPPGGAQQWSLIILTPGAVGQAPELENLLRKGLDAAGYLFLPSVTEAVEEALCRLRPKVVSDGGEEICSSQGTLLSWNDPLVLHRPPQARLAFEQRHLECEANHLESVSGPGSTLAQTEELRQRLPLPLQHIGARSLLDAPCGDFNWMQHVNLGVERYFGVDILPVLIERNRARYASATRSFEIRDIMHERLPRADVILCRDCLVHFSFRAIEKTLANFRRSGASYLLATTWPSVTENTDIATGGWRPLNLELAPFRFPKPLALINEKCTEEGGRYADKSLGLWLL